MFSKKLLFFRAGAGRSRAFMGGAETEIIYLEPEPKKRYLEPEPEPRKNGSAPQHWIKMYWLIVLFKFYSTFINGFNSGEQECKEAQDQEEEKEDRERQQKQEEWTEIGPRSTMLNHFSSS